MILHTVNKPPTQHHCLADCLRNATSGDALLLIEDGVYASQEGAPGATLLAQRQELDCYVLEEDLLMRGLKRTMPRLKRIGYADFVQLAVHHEKIISWF